MFLTDIKLKRKINRYEIAINRVRLLTGYNFWARRHKDFYKAKLWQYDQLIAALISVAIFKLFRNQLTAIHYFNQTNSCYNKHVYDLKCILVFYIFTRCMKIFIRYACWLYVYVGHNNFIVCFIQTANGDVLR